jgi:hypothetical protein
MLGRLRMTVQDCIDAYIRLSSVVFQRQHMSCITLSGKIKARYSSEVLKNAIKEVVKAQGLEEDALLKDHDTSSSACKVSVYQICLLYEAH